MIAQYVQQDHTRAVQQQHLARIWLARVDFKLLMSQMVRQMTRRVALHAHQMNGPVAGQPLLVAMK